MSNQNLVTRVDLHVHTTASDGLKTPEQILTEALFGLVSFTDHDNLDGYLTPIPEDKKRGAVVIPGVEVSILLDTRMLGYKKSISQELHFLGYGLDSRNTELNSELKKNRERRPERLREIVRNLNRILDREKITEDDLKELLRQPSPSKTHLARLLKNHRYTRTTQEAFERYLTRPDVDVQKRLIPSKIGSRLIKQAGGIVVLAHPFGHENDSLTGITSELEYQAAIIKNLAEEGIIQGLECYHPLHLGIMNNALPAFYFSLCKKFKLVPTGGSDYHGDKKGDQLGRFYVPDFIGKLLLERLAA